MKLRENHLRLNIVFAVAFFLEGFGVDSDIIKRILFILFGLLVLYFAYEEYKAR